MQRPLGHKQPEGSSKSTGKTLLPLKWAANINMTDVIYHRAKENATFFLNYTWYCTHSIKTTAWYLQRSNLMNIGG